MATTRLREKSLRKDHGRKLRSSITDDVRKIKEESPPQMSLDVLAQVASATLQKQDQDKRCSSKKVSKRSITSMEELNLDQIQGLSDKALINLFSDLSANEMSRNYTYTCFLMPERCHDEFTSFGNEQKARMQMRTHLLGHIERLIDDANDPKMSKQFNFTATPVHVRKKKELELTSKKKRSGGEPYNKQKKRILQKSPSFTALKPSKTGNSQVPQEQENLKIKTEPPDRNSESLSEFRDYLKSDDGKDENKFISIRKESPKKNMTKRYAHKQLQNVKDKNRNYLNTKSKARKADLGKKQSGSETDSLNEETERRIEENEQFIIDLLSRTQPHHDHCYTTIFGKKHGIETMHFQMLRSEAEHDLKKVPIGVGDYSLYSRAEAVQPMTPIQPIRYLDSRLPVSGGEILIVCAEEVVDGGVRSDSETESDEGSFSHNYKPYPPMAKSSLAEKGRIPMAEEAASNSDNDDIIISEGNKRSALTQTDDDGAVKHSPPEWERRLALRYIRELKGKKKEDKVPLMCRICKDKTFTACATLNYHYRSHAGIKPFVCLICHTTFTRQHSLNYHMLIHNNQSRFTCKDCGRKFRHPSHFKEHLRRHTGETPFVCSDCPQKFKTRNTYKRHLKTRHGKLLTAAGIHLLSVEEWAKVRTKPYRRTDEEKREEMPQTLPGFQTLIPILKIEQESEESSEAESVSEHSTNAEQIELEQEIMPSVETGQAIVPTVESEQEIMPSDQQSYYVPIGIVVNT